MPFVVKSGARVIGTTKRNTKTSVNKVLAKQFRKDNKVSILKLRTMRKRRKK